MASEASFALLSWSKWKELIKGLNYISLVWVVLFFVKWPRANRLSSTDTSHPRVWTQREAKFSGVKPKLVEKDLVRTNSSFKETDLQVVNVRLN